MNFCKELLTFELSAWNRDTKIVFTKRYVVVKLGAIRLTWRDRSG